jgi:uncharacterized protein YciI
LAAFLYRLNPPRPTFPGDITPAEGAAMQQHFAYWGARMAEGRVLVVGPVMDPDGPYGIAILTVADEATASAICAADPVLVADLGFSYQLFELHNALVKDVR